jgi:hypothetical protein
VAEGRVPEVVGEPGHLDDVRVAAEGLAQLAADLGHLEAVGEPGAREVGLAGDHDLGLGRQPSQRCAVQDPGPVALVGATGGPLHGLLDPPLGGGVVVGCGHKEKARRW